MKKTLLLVDDEPAVLQALQRLLRPEKYQILTANNAVDALDILKQNSVQVIVSDQRMPYMTGSEFLKQVKQLYPDTVRIILSGYADFSVVTDAINSGIIYKFLVKPWENEPLRQHIQEAFQYYELTWQQKYQASYDKVTGLGNRFGFAEQLQKSILAFTQSKKDFAIFYLGLDKLKTIRSTLGLSVGDQLLAEVTKRFLLFAEEGTVTGRVGDDEFAFLVATHDPSDTEMGIQKILGSLAKPFQVENHEIHLTGTLGVGLYPKDGQQAESIMSHAFLAMNQAKALGRPFLFYDATMTTASQAQLGLENDLHAALGNNEFVLYYQPQVDCATKKLIGFEALLRWNHPTLGLVSPLQFIPLAESSGAIIPIGDWVLKTACEQIKQWNAQGHDISVAVNLSARQFLAENLCENIVKIVRASGIDPKYLELELTESAIMQDTDKAKQVLRALSQQGFKLAMDDFGTGYSSLSYLQQFPFNRIKIDKSFVQTIQADSENIITLAILALSKSLGLEVVAEGVETEEQWQFLQNHGCDIIQGFVVSRPRPEAEITSEFFK